MNIDIENITEPEAMELFHALRSKCKWAGTVFNIEDVVYAIESELESVPTPQQVRTVMSSKEWTHGMREAMTQAGFEWLNQSVYEILIGGK